MPVGLEKHAFRNRIEPILKKTLAFLVRQDSVAGTELIYFVPNFPKITKKKPTNQMRSFFEVIKPVVFENYEFENRHLYY